MFPTDFADVFAVDGDFVWTKKWAALGWFANERGFRGPAKVARACEIEFSPRAENRTPDSLQLASSRPDLALLVSGSGRQARGKPISTAREDFRHGILSSPDHILY
jgi:hypothetical protein